MLFSLNLSAQVIKQSPSSEKYISPIQLLHADRAGNKIHFRKLTAIENLSSRQDIINGPGTCNTATFYLHLTPGSGQKIKLKELQTLPGGDFIMAADITLPNSQQEGLVCILNNSGNIVSQTQLRVNNKPTTLYSTKIYGDGTFVIAGVMHDASDKVFVSCLNQDLSVKWLKIFDLPSSPVKVTLDLVDANIAVGVQLQDAIWYSFLNSDGTVIWQKEIAVTGLDDLVGFSPVLYSELSILINRTFTGKKQSEIYEIELTGGNVLSNYIVGNGNDEYKYSHSRSFNSRIISAGIIKKSPTDYQLVRDIYGATQYEETEHTYTIPESIDFNTSCALDNSGNVMGFCFPQQGKLVFLRHFAYYQTSPEYTREYNVPVGTSIEAVAKSFIDGGYLFGLNTENSNGLILIKTDSIGTLPGCGYKEISNSYQEFINKPNILSVATSFNTSVVAFAGVLNKNIASIAGQFDCNQNYCPAPPYEDSCLSSFYKTFRSSSEINSFNASYLMQNDNHLILTGRVDNILNNQNIATGGIQVYNAKGDFIKGVDVYYDNSSASPSSFQIDKKNVLLLNYTSKNGVPTYSFTLVDDNLQNIWTKTVNFNGISFGSNLPGNVVTDTEGNLYFIGCSLGFQEKPKVLVYKMDKNGNGLWFKQYEIEKGNFLISSAVATKTSLIIVNEGGPDGSVSVCIDKNTGEMKSAYLYQNSSAGEVYTRFLGLENDHIFYAGNDGQDNLVIGTFDTTGKPIKFKTFVQSQTLPRAATSKAGMLYILYNYYDGAAFKDVILKADTALNIRFQNNYTPIHYGYASGMAVSDNGSIYATGNFFYGGNNGSYADSYLEKFDANGILGTCGYQIGSSATVDINLRVQPLTFDMIQGNFFSDDIPVRFVPDNNGNVVSDILCSSTQQCNSVKVSGPSILCELNQTYHYTAATNPGCTLQPIWIYDTSFVALKKDTGLTADFIFKRPGITWLKVKLNAGCNIYLDSINVKIQNKPIKFSLGNDTILCSGDNIKLKAGNGFTSYLWNDGSTDSILVVKVPGLYFVRVKNLCGDGYTDTVNITKATIPSLIVSSPSFACVGDTVLLNASSGFSNYEWSPPSLFMIQGPRVDFRIVHSDTVTLVASTADGCHLYDTIYVTSLNARPVYLGNDTAFCGSQSITLSAGSGYSKYEWSTGSNASGINVNESGSYWVQALDANGCTAKDTVQIQVYASPVPDLGNDFDLCSGDQRTLDAGNFTSYLWQNGSAQRYYTAQTKGMYWVTVTDNHNCSGSDTVIIRNLLPVPSDFLDKYDSLCQYEKLQIQAKGNYKTYLWSNGSVQSGITADAPGQYILTVMDNNGCKGADTINIIQKNCYFGLYIPNAFTPNGDQLNDVFRARVYGTVLSFNLSIYNRFGEIVFSSTDPLQGWDGTTKGNPADAGVFVWQCSYHLQGAGPVFEKGTVTLIR